MGISRKRPPAGRGWACLVDSSGLHSMEEKFVFVRLVLGKPKPYSRYDGCSIIWGKGGSLYFTCISFEIIIKEF
jgi:hypothetical protein